MSSVLCLTILITPTVCTGNMMVDRFALLGTVFSTSSKPIQTQDHGFIPSYDVEEHVLLLSDTEEEAEAATSESSRPLVYLTTLYRPPEVTTQINEEHRTYINRC